MKNPDTESNSTKFDRDSDKEECVRSGRTGVKKDQVCHDKKLTKTYYWKLWLFICTYANSIIIYY